MHISAAIAFGASFDGNLLTANSLHGNEINFDKASVGATVNAILLASSAKGESVIRGCAVEPHIDLLIDFLNSCGADIKRFDRELRISGRELHGGNIRINSDMIEAGSYLALSAMLGNGIKVACCPTDEMTSVFAALNDLGANIECDSNGRLSASIEKYKPISLVAAPYPDFPTDLQPIFAPLMALFGGGSITDTVWEGRFGYLNSLSDFGVQSSVDKNKAHIHRSRLHNGITWATDLRGGMAALMCALCAEGRSEILSAEIILRGYENLVEKLCSVGADIRIDYYN